MKYLVALTVATLYFVSQVVAVANVVAADNRASIAGYVGQLRDQLMSYGEAKRCKIMWKNIESKISNKSDLDVVNLARVSEIIRKSTGDLRLINFVDDCIRVLTPKYKPVLANKFDNEDYTRYVFPTTNKNFGPWDL